MNKYQALYNFWSSFNLPVYDETSVPDDAKLPYITYETGIDSWGSEIAMSASLWYRSSSWTDISLKAEEIASFITRGGKMVKYDGGCFWIKKGTPWAQRLGDESDEMIRRVILSIQIEFLD